MPGRHIQLDVTVTPHELGRYLIIKGPRPDWFVTPADRSQFEISAEVTLELIRIKYIKSVHRYNSGQSRVVYSTEPLSDDAHELIVPAGSKVRVLPDYSFFISDVLIRRAGLQKQLPGQASFYPPVPQHIAHHGPERLEYSIALRTYSGMRF